jgi:hypothetical protein
VAKTNSAFPFYFQLQVNCTSCHKIIPIVPFVFSLYPLCLKDGVPEMLPMFILYQLHAVWSNHSADELQSKLPRTNFSKNKVGFLKLAGKIRTLSSASRLSGIIGVANYTNSLPATTLRPSSDQISSSFPTAQRPGQLQLLLVLLDLDKCTFAHFQLESLA